MKKIILMFFTLLLLFSFTSCKDKGGNKKNEDDKYKVTFVIEDKTEEQTFNKGEEITYEPTLSGKLFTGWYLDSALSNPFNGTVNSDLTLYAEFVTAYNVTLHVLDNTYTIQVMEFDTIVDIDDPVVDGYKFIGWYKDSRLRVKCDESYLIESDQEYYASMEQLGYYVTFVTYGSNINSIKVPVNEPFEEPEQVPNKLFGVFVGWYEDEKLSKKYEFGNKLTEDITLYAKYDEVNYDGLIDKYLPDIVNTTIELPGSNEEGTLSFSWDSSDRGLLSNSGIYNPAKTEKEITVRLVIRAFGDSEETEQSKKVKIAPYVLQDVKCGEYVVGYSSTWYYKTYSKELIDTVNVIDLSFAYVYETFTLNLTGLETLFSAAVPEAHAKGIRVLLSVQGYGADTQNFSDAANSATGRKTLAKSMAQTVEKYHLDGIDIDWEYPGSANRETKYDKVNYTLLMQEIRNELDKLGDGYLLTAAIPGGPWGADRFEMAAVSEIFDFINMMSYDCEATKSGSHHVSLMHSDINGTGPGCSIDETVALWTSQGVPLNKICLGMAFYGKEAKVTSNKNHGLGQPIDTSVTTSSYKNVAYTKLWEVQFEKIGSMYEYYWDESACMPCLIAKQGYFRTYDNERSVIAKCEYALKNKLAGVMIWELGEDQTDHLITAVAQGMGKHLEYRDYLVAGETTLKVGDVITLTQLQEIELSKLKDLTTFVLSDETLGSLDGNTLTLTKAGTLTVKAYNATDDVCYGELVITIK